MAKPKDKFKNQYLNAKKFLLENNNICKANRDLFNDFFDYQEYKLKRMGGRSRLDESNYRTLYGYIQKFRNTNKWFKNKEWKKLTEQDIKEVYDNLEDGKIRRPNGKPYEDLSNSYYSKVFKGKPFEIAGKAQLARNVIQFNSEQKKEVRFITEDDFRKLVKHSYKPIHRLLFWIAWDIGENINSLLKLKKSDFYKQKNPLTEEMEYRINLKQKILKRSRTSRSELTNYPETVEFLDEFLNGIDDDDYLFKFNYGSAKKIIDRAVERAEIKCTPNGEKVTWKDLRSGMACDLLSKGWTTDEVNARLGHKPSSDEIDVYVNFLAIDRNRPKKKVEEFKIKQLKQELEASKEREKLNSMRMESMQKQVEKLVKNQERFDKALKIIELTDGKIS